MRVYGCGAAQRSLMAMRQAVDVGPLRLAWQRLFFRTVDRVPALKRWMANGMGRD
jgi:hypothetical protein